MKKQMIFACATFAAVNGLFALTVTDVTARQRWPWNSLVDVDFTVNGAKGEAYSVDIDAVAGGGITSLVARTFVTEPIAATGKNRVVWNLGADYPDFRTDDLKVTVTITPFSDVTPVYLVVDLSNGAEAATYPVRYTTTAPVHTAGQNDPCKTSELWLKRVKAGTIQMGGGTDGYPVHTCTLTNDFYLGVFPLTWGQYVNIGDGVNSVWAPQFFTNEAYRTTRPLDRLRFDVVRDSKYLCPNDSEIYSDSILKRLRNRTGLGFDLPTEWQWEYAARAGSTKSKVPTSQHRAKSEPNEDYEYYEEKGMWSVEYGTFYVDAHSPNDWGFYSMVGNVRQWCINRKMTITEGDVLLEPMGADADGQTRPRMVKGVDWTRGETYRTYGWRTGLDSWNVVTESNVIGARVCLTIKKEESK